MVRSIATRKSFVSELLRTAIWKSFEFLCVTMSSVNKNRFRSRLGSLEMTSLAELNDCHRLESWQKLIVFILYLTRSAVRLISTLSHGKVEESLWVQLADESKRNNNQRVRCVFLLKYQKTALYSFHLLLCADNEYFQSLMSHVVSLLPAVEMTRPNIFFILLPNYFGMFSEQLGSYFFFYKTHLHKRFFPPLFGEL